MTTLRRALIYGAVGTALLVGGCWFWRRPTSSAPSVGEPGWDRLSADAEWPWAVADQETPVLGVTHWSKRAADGTGLDLVRFDFRENPKLRFEMYDQDQDGKTAWTNKVKYAELGVARAAKRVNESGRGRVVAATNGLFFHATGSTEKDFASHVTPVVVDGKVRSFGESIRWMIGVKYTGAKPHFVAIHTPKVEEITGKFDFAAGGAQVLVLEGKPAQSPAEQTGQDSAFEKMRTSRVAWGWSKDDRFLYLLCVKEPDSEIVSKIAAKRHQSLGGGWMLGDVRQFFLKLGVWMAFNSDAGDVGQMVLLRPDGRYDFVPPRIGKEPNRRVLGADLNGGAGGGALMYWYVSEAAQKTHGPITFR